MVEKFDISEVWSTIFKARQITLSIRLELFRKLPFSNGNYFWTDSVLHAHKYLKF